MDFRSRNINENKMKFMLLNIYKLLYIKLYERFKTIRSHRINKNKIKFML